MHEKQQEQQEQKQLEEKGQRFNTLYSKLQQSHQKMQTPKQKLFQQLKIYRQQQQQRKQLQHQEQEQEQEQPEEG